MAVTLPLKVASFALILAPHSTTLVGASCTKFLRTAVLRIASLAHAAAIDWQFSGLAIRVRAVLDFGRALYTFNPENFSASTGVCLNGLRR